MKYPKHPGVYAIRHIDSGKAYIGSSRNIYARWRSHKSDLRRGKHACAYLQNAWSKYGEATFRFEVLEVCFDDPVILMSLEQNWLDRSTAKLYNSSKFSEPNTGRKMSETQREALRLRMLGNRNGANSTNSVLTESEVSLILYRFASGVPLPAIAEEFGVNEYTVRRIAKRETWSRIAIPDDVDSARIERLKHRETSRTDAQSKVTPDDARLIREMAAAGAKRKDIMSQFGISSSYAHNLMNGKARVHTLQARPDLTKPDVSESPKLKPIRKGYRVRKPSKPRAKMPPLVLNCGNCGSEFTRPQCYMRRESKSYYCSVPCRNAKASERNIDVMKNQAVRAKLAAAQTGKKASEATKAKMSAAQTRRYSKAAE